jgi:RimJ/RimL family protein N-acetyltransferase
VNISFQELHDPTLEIAAAFSKWENDPALIPFIRPHQDQASLEARQVVTVETLRERLAHDHIHLIFVDDVLVGEMDFQVDPKQLFKKEPGTAWIGINIGEASARGKGVGRAAFAHLEQHIRSLGLTRMELGVFEFNAPAIRMYHNAGFTEIARLNDFTYWQGRMWPDIRMEKYLTKD